MLQVCDSGTQGHPTGKSVWLFPAAAPKSEELLSLKFSPTLQKTSEWLLTLSPTVFLPLHATLKGEGVSLKVQSISK